MLICTEEPKLCPTANKHKGFQGRNIDEKEHTFSLSSLSTETIDRDYIPIQDGYFRQQKNSKNKENSSRVEKTLNRQTFDY